MDQHISRFDTNTDNSGEQPNHGVGPKLTAILTEPPTDANKCRLIQGDCLKEMVNISDRSIDLILCDLSFGNSGFGWDRPIDLASRSNTPSRDLPHTQPNETTISSIV